MDAWRRPPVRLRRKSRRYGDDRSERPEDRIVRKTGRGDILRPGQQDLTRRRHVDLVRVSSALCRPGR
ncbi:putative leader peptide [Streptomyces sp. NPDC059568]|uniref:putative leader peptide n=1 Tax=Streptomyces sp. NPDC059568 TaxID=3346868 RepID=UPI0036B8DF41